MTPTISQILTVAGIACDCTAADIVGPSRKRNIAYARRIAATLMRHTRRMSTKDIGDVLHVESTRLVMDKGCNSPHLSHARSLLAKLYADEQALLVQNLSVGEIIAAIETRQDVAVAVGCYIGEVMRKKHQAVAEVVHDG